MLLTAKLKSPSTPQYALPREDLERQLLAFTDYKVTLVSAPAGYGKTTLVAKFLKSQSFPYAWYSLDRSDNNPVTFWSYLIQSLRRMDINLGKKSLALLNSELEGSQHNAIIQLLEDLNNFQARYLSGQDGIIVLDDFQEIESPEVLEQINFFIEYLPDNFHLLVTSRSIPSLHIAKRSARGELLLFVKEQLCLSREESINYLSKKADTSTLDISVDEVSMAAAGWFGALQILCIHLKMQQRVPDTHSLHRLADFALMKNYIDHEVLGSLAPSCYTLLVRIAPLPRFLDQMINDLIGEEEGKAWLQHLLDLNLIFVDQDEEGSWYSVHGLIRERLIKVNSELSNQTDFSNQLLNWLMAKSMWSEIFEFSILTENWQWASRVALHSMEDIVRSGQSYMIRSLISRFPRSVLGSMPKLSLFEVWSDFQCRGHDHAKVRLEKLKQLISELGDEFAPCWLELGIESEQELSSLNEFIFIIEFQINLLSVGPTYDSAVIERVERYLSHHQTFSNWCWNGLGANAFLAGRIDEAIAHLTKAYFQSQADKDGTCLLVTLASLGPSLIFSGDATRAIELCDETSVWCLHQGYDAIGLYSIVERVRALAYRELNQLDKAKQHCAQMNLALPSLDPLHKLYHTWTEVVLTLGQDTQHCRILVARLEKYFKSLYVNWNLGIPDPLLLNCILDVQEGDPKAIIRWAKAFRKRLKSSASSSQQFTFELLVYSRYLLEKGKNPTKEICFLVDGAEEGGNLFLQLKAQLLLAVYCYRKRDLSKALVTLTGVIVDAEQKKLVRTVLDEWQLLVPMLKDSAFLSLLKESIGKRHGTVGEGSILNTLIDEHISDHAKGQALSTLPKPDLNQKNQLSKPYISELTKRELDVLKSISGGLSNEDVGSALNISTSTVKTHVANIYSKLHVKSRTHAVLVARENGWVKD